MLLQGNLKFQYLNQVITQFYFYLSLNNQTFTVTRIKSVVDYFEERGHSVIVIVPEKEVQGRRSIIFKYG
jgi:hypothetical protein